MLIHRVAQGLQAAQDEIRFAKQYVYLAAVPHREGGVVIDLRRRTIAMEVTEVEPRRGRVLSAAESVALLGERPWIPMGPNELQSLVDDDEVYAVEGRDGAWVIRNPRLASDGRAIADLVPGPN